MEEITKLKAEAYDIFAQIQALQQLLAEKNQKINDILQAEQAKNTPKEKKS